MKKKKVILIILFILIISVISAGMISVVADDGSATQPVKNATTSNSSDAEEELSENLDTILGELDLKSIEDYFNSLTEEQKALFGSSSLMERLRLIVSGEMKMSYGDFFSYMFASIGVSFTKYIPFIVGVIAISIAFSLLQNIRSKSSSESVQNIVHFANMALIVIFLLIQLTGIITATMKLISSLQAQMNLFFPIILTLMVSVGAGTSAGVYQPAVAVLSSGISEIIIVIILPCFILSNVFTIIGNLSDGIKLKKMSDFFGTVSKWLLGTMFFLFMAFLSIQGITASIYDGVSVRTAKFALSKYVPIIGGYLSEGLNLFLAGSVLVKNAVGMTGVIMLIVSVIPVLAQIIVFNLSLHLTAAIIEPLGNSKVSSMLTTVAKNTAMLAAIVLAITFLYFIFLILVVSTGNVSI